MAYRKGGLLMATPNSFRTRRNVLKLPANDRTMYWYARAVAEMQKLSIGESGSWRYQAAIHDYNPALDPYASSLDKMPSQSEMNKYWKQCQHHSWFFLAWHRMYLHYFEQIVLRQVVALGGPSDWALPYWNYSAREPGAALLPKPFRDLTADNGAANPLRIEARNVDANAGKAFTDSQDVDITTCLVEPKYAETPIGGSPGFGGPVTGFSHGDHGGTEGLLEQQPHDTMHGAIAGDGGWMDNFTQAPLDPVFWLHHCNIDRLWETWLKRDPTHKNPGTANWLTSIPFYFHDAAGTEVQMTPSQVLDTRAAPLEYVYDDTSDPITPAMLAAHPAFKFGSGPVMVPSAEALMAQLPPGESPIPEKIGSTAAPIQLQRELTRHLVEVHKPTGPALLGVRAAPRRVFLHIEGVRSNTRSRPYDVYLDLPRGANPAEHSDLRVGRMAMFGLVESSKLTTAHPDHGLHYTFEVTSLYNSLMTAPGSNARNLQVSFVPVLRAPAGASGSRSAVTSGAATGPEIAQVTLYIA